MLKDIHKKELSTIITRYRPDLTKELLQKDSFIYSLVEEKLDNNPQESINYEILERAWLDINLENPIPNKSSEIDLVIEKFYPKLKEEFYGLAMYNNILIAISDKDTVEAVFKKHFFFSENFKFNSKFESDLKEEIHNYLENEGYV